MVDVDICRMVLAVAETGNFSKAARKMYISQPLLSKHISRLEDELGTELFDRKSRPTTMTESGRIFVEYAKRFIELERSLLEELDAVSEKKDLLTIGVNNAGSVYAGKLHSDFAQRYPGISISYEHLSNEDCEHALEGGVIDIAIFNTPVESGEVEYHILTEEVLYLCVSKDHKIFEGMDTDHADPQNPVLLDVEAIREANLQWFCAPEDSGMARTERDFFRKCGIKPQKSILDYPEARRSMVANGGGACILGYETGSQDGVICCKVDGIDLHRYIILAKKRHNGLSEVSKIYWSYAIKQKIS